MIDRILALAVRHRLFVIAAGTVLALWGVYAAFDTPVDAIPDLSENQVIVYADWPGRGPREVEEQVTYPLSVGLRGVRGVRVVRGASDVGYSWLSVIFEDDVAYAEARRALGERLGGLGATLPAGVVPRMAPDAAATGQIFWYTVEGGGLDLGRLRALQDFYVGPQLAAVSGIAEVASAGGALMEYQVSVDPVRLRAEGVTIEAVIAAVAASNGTTGGGVVQKGNAEFVVRSVGRLGSDGVEDPKSVVRDLDLVPVPRPSGGIVRLVELARIAPGPAPRRGMLEKDGVEVAGGVVVMKHGENPRAVTERVKRKIRELRAGLPVGVKIIPFYDRTPLIDGALATVRGTLVEAMVTASVSVLLVLMHLRTSLAIAVTIPLAALASFALMWLLRALGIANIETNVMSLAGIAISIGVLVDSSVVMAENVMHRLKERFGDRPVRGDVREDVLAACRQVGRPIVFSVLIMLLSFLPVFALGGMEGKMFRPLALTKCLALAASAVLAVTLVPALCTYLVRGRLRGEMESPIVRAVVEVYRPVLSYSLDHPGPLAWVLAATFVVGLAPVGSRELSIACLLFGLIAVLCTLRRPVARVSAAASLLGLSAVATHAMTPLGREFMTPLDEGMLMDMPITVPRASITQSGDDVKARDMVLCRFPEVAMVVGKAGRAETPTDPAPPDMIETMVELRPREHWPRRSLSPRDAKRQAAAILDALIARGVLDPPTSPETLLQDAVAAALERFEAVMRETAYQSLREFERTLPRDAADRALDGLNAIERRLWAEHIRKLDGELIDRGAAVFTRAALEELLLRGQVRERGVATYMAELRRLRSTPAVVSAGHHHATAQPGSMVMPRGVETPGTLHAQPILDSIQAETTRSFARRIVLWKKAREELAGFGGELDRAVSMPGWTNVWTMPIQNRVDMLATGVNTAVGIRVMGRRLDDVVAASEAIAAEVKSIPGAIDVVADPIRGKGYIEVQIDRLRAGRLGVSAADVNSAVEAAVGGVVATSVLQGRERHAVRVRYGRDWRQDEAAIRRVLVAGRGADGTAVQVPLTDVAEIRVLEGPATIRSENGLLRNYVRLNVHGRSAADFVAEARGVVAGRVKLPEGSFIEWTGRFEHEARAAATLRFIVPIVLGLILVILYATYRDIADAVLMLTAVPGAVAGGVLFQWLMGAPFSVTVWVGYIACFGMATSTGIIMLVYLRDAIDRAGGLEALSFEGLRRAVLDGAAHRLRPKLLTEGTTVLGLAPVLWSVGVGSEVIRPMAAPVLGGILIADEVIDLLLPVLFFHIRKRRLAKLHRSRPPHARREELPANVGGRQ